jgi:predicted RNA-binding Zn-ribbon protein involved in translation (DUF1610 family)
MDSEEEHEVPTTDDGRKPRRTLAEMKADSMAREGSSAWACPKCGCKDFRVARTWHLGNNKKRLRECRHCGETLTTCEVPVPDTYGYVLKKPSE